MKLNSLYHKSNSSLWQGRVDLNSSYFHQIIQIVDLNRESIRENGFGILGFESDEGIRKNQGRVGAEQGPSSFRQALGKLPYFRNEHTSLIDYGNIVCLDGNLEASQKSYGEIVSQLLNARVHPILIGGGHEIAYGTYLGIKEKLKESELTIINFDAHYDLRTLTFEKSTSGNSFFQIAQDRFASKKNFNYVCFGIQKYSNSSELHERASNYSVKKFYAEEFFIKPIDFFQNELDKIISESENIYVSICMDVFNQAFAPGVSAPQPLGIHPWHVIPLLRQLAQSNKILGIEIAELSPPLDIQNFTSRLAASLICDYIHEFK